MSNQENFSFVVVKYPFADTGLKALAAVQLMAKEGQVKLKDAVAINKNEKGKIKLHQTKDDTAGKGFLKGGLIGIIFTILFGGAGWIVAGAMAGAGLGIFDRGIKNKLLKELGENMTADESAIAVLIEEADWGALLSYMDSHFTGEVVVEELLVEHMAQIEALIEHEAAVAAVPEELALETE